MLAKTSLVMASIILIAGCTGGPAPVTPAGSSAAAPHAPEAFVTESLGGIEGTLVDDSLAPVANATVLLLPPDLKADAPIEIAVTALDGSFSFSRIVPGAYRVVVSEGGNASSLVHVVEAEVAQVRLVLAAMATQASYIETVYKAGFSSCSMYLILQLAVGNGCKAVSTSAGAPPSATKWKVPATDGVRSSVVATTWKRNDAIFAPTSFVSQIFVSNQTADDQAYYHDEHGKTVNNISTGRSPVVVRLNGIPGHLSIGLTVLSDAFVVENPYEFSFQQRFDVWIALFHNADAPADYSPLPDR